MSGGMGTMAGTQGGGGQPKTIKLMTLPTGNLISAVKLQVKTGSLLSNFVVSCVPSLIRYSFTWN